MKTITLLLWTLFLIPSGLFAEIPVGNPLPHVVLSGEEGGLVEGGGAWNSDTLKGKVSVIFYVDPDERDLNESASDALRADESLADYRKEGKYASYAIINMAATWLPNAVLKGMIEDKQKEFPNTIYIFDMGEVIHKKWGIATDNNDVLVTDPAGNVVFSKDGKLSEADIKTMLESIHEHL